jgi:zinc/manganese transport system substrate-binding protein
MQRRTLLAAPLLLIPSVARAQGAVPVVASFSVLADMVRMIGGPAVTISTIVGPDRDAHGFQARPSDQRTLQASRAAFANGLGFDPWMDRMVRAVNFRGPFVKAADGVTTRTMTDTHGHDHGGGGRAHRHTHGPRTVTDPHAWQDLGTAPIYARNIAAGLKQVLPGQESAIDARASEFVAKAAETDAWVRSQIATVPADRRRVITSHDAFGYFAAAYGVEFLAPQGISTESEPSAAEVARLIRQIREQNIRALFMENMTNPRLLEQVARDAGVQVAGRLYADALSGPDGPAPTYFAMFRHNVTLLVRAMLQ